MLSKLLPVLLLPTLTATMLSAQDVEVRFTTDKVDYLVGEPIFVTLTASNNGNAPIWVDFKSPDMPLLCHDFAVEVPGAAPARQWGCGFGGSCGRGFREVPPGSSITLRQLLNAEFRFERLGTYTLHAHTAVVVHSQNVFNSPEIGRLEVSGTLRANLQSGSESQVKLAFQPFVEDLNSPQPTKRNDAAYAITELAPAFLEDVLIDLTKSSYAYAAIEALRRADTLKTRAALAQIATDNGDPLLRITAIYNLGCTNDMTYLPTLFQLMESNDKQIQNSAAEAAGNLGGPTAVNQLATLVSSPDALTRLAGTNRLGNTYARQAVKLLIGMLLDSDASVRQAAVSGCTCLNSGVGQEPELSLRGRRRSQTEPHGTKSRSRCRDQASLR